MSYDDNEYSVSHFGNIIKITLNFYGSESASSAPVGRIFNNGGVIVRPCRPKMNSRTLAPLPLLKHNSNIV